MLSQSLSERRSIQSLGVINKTFKNNKNSDYTEKIKQLEKSFDYSSNSHEYWCFPEQSILYGTPFYEVASESQKKALNHLYWVMQYSKIATDEVGTVLFNQLTASVFSQLEGSETLCQELELETAQEKYHIHAFQRVGYLTRKSLLENTSLSSSIKPKNNNNLADFYYKSSYKIVKNISKVFLENAQKYPSPYLQELDSKQNLRLPTEGLINRLPFLLKIPMSHLLFRQCGTSPFIASQFYAIRFIANMMLKNWEYNYVRYFKQQKKVEKFIPIPTQISHLHLWDESFHTTISKYLFQDLYKQENFPQPTAREKLIGNLMIYFTQFNLNGLSAVIPYRFVSDDASFIDLFFKLMKSPLFELSDSEAIAWLKKCFCQEHEGFHTALRNHQRLLFNLKESLEKVDYLWSVNREMKVAESANVEKAIANSKKAFVRFSKLITT